MAAPDPPAVDAQGLRSFIGSIYARGDVKAEDGTSVSLHPHGYRQDDGEALRDLAIRERAVTTIETGFCLGLSTLFICEALLASGDEDAGHICIDPFQSRWGNAGLRTVRDAGVAELVDHREAPSQVVLPALLEEDRNRFDLALVDGDHRFEGAFIDLFYLRHLVKPGGVIVVDDVWMPAVAVATNYFVINLGFEIVPAPFPGPAFTGPPANEWRRVRPGPPAATAVLRRPEPEKLHKRPWWDGGQHDLAGFEEWLRRSRLPARFEKSATLALERAARLKDRAAGLGRRASGGSAGPG